MKTITMPLDDYQKLIEENALMRKALDDKSVVVARYYGYNYHLVNADEKLNECLNKIKESCIEFK